MQRRAAASCAAAGGDRQGDPVSAVRRTRIQRTRVQPRVLQLGLRTASMNAQRGGVRCGLMVQGSVGTSPMHPWHPWLQQHREV